MQNVDLINKQIHRDVKERMAHSTRCWECNREVVHHSNYGEYPTMQERQNKHLHKGCRSNFYERITLNAYDEYKTIPSWYVPLIFHSSIVISTVDTIVKGGIDVYRPLFKQVIEEFVHKSPHNVVLESVYIDETQLVEQFAVRIGVAIRATPVCFICGSVLVIHNLSRGSWISGNSPLVEMEDLPVEQELYTLPGDKHYFHRTCMNKMVQELIIKSY